jgi:hypothetical protein
MGCSPVPLFRQNFLNNYSGPPASWATTNGTNQNALQLLVSFQKQKGYSCLCSLDEVIVPVPQQHFFCRLAYMPRYTATCR